MARCSHCHFKPGSDREKAESLVLSTDFFVDGDFEGYSDDELTKIAHQIRERTYAPNEEKVDLLLRYAAVIQSVPTKDMLRDLVRWLFLPGILFMAMLIFSLYKIGVI
ncbi:hypothetical protein KPL74_02550 [Bacillus sp. NP157]|nr:hypothetical protein KPL74_02550 [Bacillus sp. NP157]